MLSAFISVLLRFLGLEDGGLFSLSGSVDNIHIKEQLQQSKHSGQTLFLHWHADGIIEYKVEE